MINTYTITTLYKRIILNSDINIKCKGRRQTLYKLIKSMIILSDILYIVARDLQIVFSFESAV